MLLQFGQSDIGFRSTLMSTDHQLPNACSLLPLSLPLISKGKPRTAESTDGTGICSLVAFSGRGNETAFFMDTSE